jgi:riboflavin kinase/FMN adenylyltransferase
MQVIRSIDGYDRPDDLLLSIGVFDGVHLGHRAVLRSLVEQRRSGRLAAALTFEHHPQAFLHPDDAPKAITTADEKVNLLAACGLDLLFLLKFDERIAQIDAETFLRDILVSRLHVRQLVVGDNWRFGKGAAGDVALAKRVLEPLGCRSECAVLTQGDGETISSSRIRSLIEARRFDEADRLLGSPYTVRGIVEAGDGRGHLLGFPTANLRIAEDKLIPPDGIYAAVAHHDGDDRTAVVSIGSKPTFGGKQRVVEAYLLDFDGSIYGEQLSLRDWRHVRDQIRYDGPDALVRQMKLDAEAVREMAGRS